MNHLQRLITLTALLSSVQAEEETPTCNDREILTDGECQACPTWTRAQEQDGRAYCHSDRCDYKTQIVQTDGTCDSCPEGFEPDVNMVDCNKIGLKCSGNEAKSGSKCMECPKYTRPQSDNSYCSPDFCDQNSIILPNGKCEACDEGKSPDLIWRRQCVTNKRNQECNGRQIELKDHTGVITCQDCPDFTRAQQSNWYCSADQCEFNQIVRKDGTCLNCPRGETPDDSRLKCKPMPEAVIVNDDDEPSAPASEEAAVEEESQRCEPSWQITLKDGSCAACPEFTRPQSNNECAPDICARNEFLHEWGYCIPCQSGWVHDRTGRECEQGGNLLSNFEPITCGDREHRSIDGLECFQCPDYTRAQDRNTKCAGNTCKIFQIQKVDGTCEDCSEGTRPNFMQRNCVQIVDPSTCTDSQVYVEVMNMCEQCPEFTRPQGDHCAPDKCADNQALQPDGTCGRVTCGDREILGNDGVTCTKCMDYTRPMDNGTRCGQEYCPNGIVQYDGTCVEYGAYLTNLKVEKNPSESKQAPQLEQVKQENDNAAVVAISVLSTVVFGLLAFILYKFREGTKAVPPSQEVEAVQVRQQVAAPRDYSTTSKKLIIDEGSFANIEEVPQENIQDSVKVPIASEE